MINFYKKIVEKLSFFLDYSYDFYKKRDFLQWFLTTVFVSVLYIFWGYVGFLFAIPPGNITAIWVPSGLSVGLILFLGWNRTMLGIFLGSLLVNILGFRLHFENYEFTHALIASISIALGSLFQAGLIAFLTYKLINSSFDFLFDVFKFGFIAITSCLISSTVGVTTLWACHFIPVESYFYTWLTWLLGDAAGILLVTPLFITWKHRDFLNWKIEKWLEFILLFLSIFLVSEIVFGLEKEIAYALIFSILPLFVWAAIRFTQFEVSLSFFITACIAIISTSQNRSLFTNVETNTSYLCLQFFIAITGLTKLVISTSLYELRKAKGELQNAYNNVEYQVTERTKELALVNENLKFKIQEQEEDKEKLRIFHIENERLRRLTDILDKRGDEKTKEHNKNE